MRLFLFLVVKLNVIDFFWKIWKIFHNPYILTFITKNFYR